MRSLSMGEIKRSLTIDFVASIEMSSLFNRSGALHELNANEVATNPATDTNHERIDKLRMQSTPFSQQFLIHQKLIQFMLN